MSMKLALDLQRRNAKTGEVVVTRKKFDPHKLGVVVIDLWNWHWCKTASKRAAAMIPRMNRALECLRPLGVQVLLCPTDVADSYVGTPQRERAVAAPSHPMPKPRKLDWPAPRGGDCMCGPGIRCVCEFGWDGMNPDFIIREQDLVSRGTQQLYSLCKERGITDLIYFGLHTNMCVMGKPSGMKPIAETGIGVMLARDVTDACTEYDPKRGYTPDDGTAEVVRHLETHCFPTVHIVDECRKLGLWNEGWIVEPIRFAPWGLPERPHHFEKPFKLTLTTPWLEGAEVRYTLDDTEPTGKSKLYTKPFTIKDTAIVRAAAFEDGNRVSFETKTYYARLMPKPPMPDVHLSDLRPCRSSSPWGGANPERINKSQVCTPLKMRGVEYEKGLGVHAPAQLMCEIKPEYDRFVALAGIDETILLECMGASVAAKPSIVFKVFIDGKLAAASPMMRVTEEPWRFNVKVRRGSKLISIAATDGGDGNRLDRGNIVNCGFVLKSGEGHRRRQ